MSSARKRANASWEENSLASEDGIESDVNQPSPDLNSTEEGEGSSVEESDDEELAKGDDEEPEENKEESEDENSDEVSEIEEFPKEPDANAQVVNSTTLSQADPNNINERLDNFQKTIMSLVEALNPKHQRVSSLEPDESWNSARAMTVSNTPGPSSSIRWDNIKPFPENVPAGKLWETWSTYIENFEIASSLSNVHDPVRRAQLLYISMGSQLKNIVKAANLRPSLRDPNCYMLLVNNIENYLRSMIDTAAEHEAFSRMMQERGETTVSFHARLMAKVRLCDYHPRDMDRFVRGQMLKGMANRDLAKIAQTFGYETSFIVQSATRDEAYRAEIAHQESVNVAAINNGTRGRINGNSNQKRFGGSDIAGPSAKRYLGDAQRKARCWRCNVLVHRNGVCPAIDRNCSSCGKRGHFAVVCNRNKRVNRIQEKTAPSGWSDDEEKSKQVNALSLGDVLIDCRLGSSTVIKFLIDSGSDVNVIGGMDWKQLKKEYKLGVAQLQPLDTSKCEDLRAYAASKPMVVKCAFRAKVDVTTLNKPPAVAEFLVIEEGRRSLLGRTTASDMRLLEVGAAVNSCEQLDKVEIFPKMPGIKVKFSIDRTVTPVKNAYYNVPAAYRERARQRLRVMELRGIIEKVETAPEWISGMSAVAKGKDDFRLVINMRAPNKAIKREYFRLPLIDEMKVKLHGARYFAKLDLTSAFYHLELSEESREITTFLSECGMYRYTRLMFGVNCAPEIFQREMTRIMKGEDNVIVYIDDFLVFGKSLSELRSTVARIMEILRNNNLTVNDAKCEMDKTRIRFLGHELDKNGFHVEEGKIKDVKKFRQPSTASELRSFLGLASFISPYIDRFSDITHPLWSVAATSVWKWGPAQDEAFELTKQKIVNCTIALGYFSENDTTVLYTDASPVALGASNHQFCVKSINGYGKKISPKPARSAWGGMGNGAFFIFPSRKRLHVKN